MSFQDRLARARAQVEAARIARGLTDFRCHNCGALIMQYEAPVKYALTKCYRCNLFSELTTERNGHP